MASSRPSTNGPRPSTSSRKSLPRQNVPIYHLGLSSDNFHDPSFTGPRPTHDLPKGGVWSLYSTTTISAPPKYVYDALIRVQEWHEWNTFTPDVRITKHPKSHRRDLQMEAGTHMVFNIPPLLPSDPKPVRYRVVCNYREKLKTRDDGHATHAVGNNITRIRWTMDNANTYLPSFVFKTERVNEIIETEDDNVTRYRTWQAFGGIQAKGYRKKYGKVLQGKFEDWSRDLKKRAEENYRRDVESGSVVRTSHQGMR